MKQKPKKSLKDGLSSSREFIKYTNIAMRMIIIILVGVFFSAGALTRERRRQPLGQAEMLHKVPQRRFVREPGDRHGRRVRDKAFVSVDCRDDRS